MKKLSSVSATALLLCSCTSQPKPQKAAEPSPQQTSQAGEVQVDAQVGRELGLSVVPAELSRSGTPVSATGQLQINEDASWQVGAITDGKIIAMPVRVGDSVKKGQALAVLHSHEVHDARATYRQALAQLAREKLMSEQARTVRDRTRRLFDLRAASREQLEAAETTYQGTIRSVASAQADVDKTRFHLSDFLEVSPEGHSEHGSGEPEGIDIKSPAAGTVMERKATVGTVVSAGDPVFTIANLNSLWLIAAVNEADMSLVRPGQQVQIRVRAYPERKFSGRVIRLGERLDAQTRTLQVRVLVPNAAGLLKPDMFATAEFATNDTRAVIQVPEPAVQDINGRTVVFVRESSGRFAARTVVTGAKEGGRIEILEGVKPGDPVVVNGAFLLKTQVMKQAGD